MVICVLERRPEIGLRRALGRPGPDPHPVPLRSQPAGPAGGAAGTGAVATAIYAHAKGWSVVIPLQARAGGRAAAVIIGAAAGLLAASG
jgi:putative ABC transport system permease protein